MREIKFRGIGKLIDRQEYVYGWGCFTDENERLFIVISPDEFIQVESIERFTGLTDREGTEIYEGDIVGEENVYHFLERDGWKPEEGDWKIIGEKSKNFTGSGEEKYIAGYKLKVVEWKDKSCGFEPFSDSEGNCGHCNGGVNPKNYEVIGNIHSNPELLTKGTI